MQSANFSASYSRFTASTLVDSQQAFIHIKCPVYTSV